MLTKPAAVCAGLFAIGQAVLLALFLGLEDDRNRCAVRNIDTACQATFAGLVAVTLWFRSLRNSVKPGVRGWQLLAVVATLWCVGQSLMLAGRLRMEPGPLQGWEVSGQVLQGLGVILVAGSAAAALWRDARRQGVGLDSGTSG